MRQILILAAAALVLAGCGTMEQAAQKECAGLSLQPGTPAFANCYEQSMARRQHTMDAIIAN